MVINMAGMSINRNNFFITYFWLMLNNAQRYNQLYENKFYF